MIRTLGNLNGAEIGFRPDGVLTLALTPANGAYPSPAERVALYEELAVRTGALPGVEGVAATCVIPMTTRCGYPSLILEGGEGTPIGDAPDGVREVVTPDYFRVLGLAVLEGRPLDASDRADAPPVAVVNETFARTIWPGQDAVGQRFRMWSEGWPYIEVVGVVRDVRNLGPDHPADPTFYVPYAQAATSANGTPTAMVLAVRTSGAPTSLVGAVREVVRAVDGAIAVSQVRSLSSVVGEALALRQFTLRLLEAFSVVALLLAAVGVYGVMSVTVGERTAEIGLRKALGAAPSRLLGTVIGEGVAVAAAGCALGLVGGIALARGMSGLLYGVSTVDPLTMVAVLLMLMLIAALSSAGPGWRASRADPTSAFRET
jgi:predicted permease